MELKFSVRDFSTIKSQLGNAKLREGLTEKYVYLRSGNKLTKNHHGYFYVTIKKNGKSFLLKKRKIDREEYVAHLKNIKRVLNNKRIIYNLGKVDISFNEMEVGKFVIINGPVKDGKKLAKFLKLKNIVTKPFSEL